VEDWKAVSRRSRFRLFRPPSFSTANLRSGGSNGEWRGKPNCKRKKGKRKAERAERERKKRMAQSRIDRLLKDVAVFQQAGAIRKYVDAIRLAVSNSEACSADELERWSQWVLSEADRIDSPIGGTFLNVLRDEDNAQEKGTPCTERTFSK
jgi:hypothetical protein